MQSKELQNINKKGVDSFLAYSNQFKNMIEIAAKPGMQNAANFVERIEKCLSLKQILDAISELDFKTPDNSTANNLARNSVNTFLYLSGFFSNGASFNYYALHLKEEIETYQNNLHYSKTVA